MGTPGGEPGVGGSRPRYKDLRLLKRRCWFLEQGWCVFVSPVDAVLFRTWLCVPGRAYRLRLPLAPAEEQLLSLGSGISEICVKKPENRRVAGVSSAGVEVDEWAVAYPLLFDHLTCRRWDDGTARQPSSLLVFEQDGSLKAMLRDREAGLCLWVASPGFGSLIAVLEAALGSAETEWRQDRQQSGESARRVKRSVDRSGR